MNVENKNLAESNSPEIKKFIKEHSYFWWWVPEGKKEKLSIDSIVEATLNYGDSKDIKILFDLVGYQKTKEVFLKQISSKRNNYTKRTLNFFKLYFSKYA